MSTFDGWVPEFPHIRIDYFRPLQGRPPPLACFLSHVHSDHLTGLESYRTPFIYCSSATRALVLRLEKYPHRMNFAKGILECHKQTYKHLSKILRPLPLDTPTTVQLAPGIDIRVTLIDANHCLGAVMFLIEGQGKAILYTGDIRAESWWTNALMRHPSLIRYTTPACRLDKMYLDTTFATKSDPYRTFPSKADGVRELLHRLSRFQDDCIFYFHAWTFGYEDVWRTLAGVLDSQIHLDLYRYSIYTSIESAHGRSGLASETPALCGFMNSNERHPGILTDNEAVRIHSCERGTGCHVFDNPDKRIIDIMPIITRHNGVELRELGAGGGNGDLNQNHELDVAMLDPAMIMALCTQATKDPASLQLIAELIKTAFASDDQRIKLDGFDDFELPEDGAISLSQVPRMLAALSKKSQPPSDSVVANKGKSKNAPKDSITFPYSRHSSYDELRELLTAFQPSDVFPCTAPPADQWTEELSMESLFGDVCSVTSSGCSYDNAMRQLQAERLSLKRKHDAMINKDSQDRSSPVPQHTQSQEDIGSETESEDDYQDVREPGACPPDVDDVGLQEIVKPFRSQDPDIPGLESTYVRSVKTDSTRQPRHADVHDEHSPSTIRRKMRAHNTSLRESHANHTLISTATSGPGTTRQADEAPKAMSMPKSKSKGSSPTPSAQSARDRDKGADAAKSGRWDEDIHLSSVQAQRRTL